ncbi:3-deoxy-D-manno-octulosonic acid transferase [Candidatus Entotheonellaceae bacterium PAL068K]
MYLVYTILLVLCGCCLLPRLIWRCFRGATYHHGLRQRFAARLVRQATGRLSGACLWFHAASVGEVHGVHPIVTRLHQGMPHVPIVFSTFTPAGQARAQSLVTEAAAVFLLPLDFPWTMRQVVRHIQPRMLIVQETELWPHLFRAAAQQQVPIVVVNGRLSPRAFSRYRLMRPLMRRVLADVTLVLAQSQDGVQRFRELGVPAQRLQVVGNTNIDRALLTAEQPVEPSALTPLLQTRRVWVGGSTHAGEETLLLSVYRRLQPQYPDLILVLAPRHLERVGTVVRQAHACQCEVLCRSQYTAGDAVDIAQPTVLILDTMGELPGLYRQCTVAFVGGSLVSIGGHNILEPAVFAKPLFFGPHMHHCPELATMLCQAGGASQVHNAEELYAGLVRILEHPDQGHAMGQRAVRALMANRGALDRTIHIVTDRLQQTGQAPFPPLTK